MGARPGCAGLPRGSAAAYGIEAAIQVGDFGFFARDFNEFSQEGPRRLPVPLHVIDGNHEDHGWLLKS